MSTSSVQEYINETIFPWFKRFQQLQNTRNRFNTTLSDIKGEIPGYVNRWQHMLGAEQQQLQQQTNDTFRFLNDKVFNPVDDYIQQSKRVGWYSPQLQQPTNAPIVTGGLNDWKTGTFPTDIAQGYNNQPFDANQFMKDNYFISTDELLKSNVPAPPEQSVGMWNRISGGAEDFFLNDQGNLDFKSLGSALSVGKDLFGMYQGWKSLGMAEDLFSHQMNIANENLAMQKDAYNKRLEARASKLRGLS